MSLDDDYDVYLATWGPSPLLRHATLDSNLFDPVIEQRLHEDMKGIGQVVRTPFTPGPKCMTDVEEQQRKLDYFKYNQADWSSDFRTRLVADGLDPNNVDLFIRSMATDWVDGLKRRQNNPVMQSVKASIRDHDLHFHHKHAEQYVLTSVPLHIEPLFNPFEMQLIFQVNCQLMETFIQGYITELFGKYNGSINRLYLRRGVFMPDVPCELRKELHHLSSYSFTLTPVEQFAQTHTSSTRNTGVPCIFSAPVPALQSRVVAFAPFIKDMDLQQMELVVAPPIEPTPLKFAGQHGGIWEYEFD